MCDYYESPREHVEGKKSTSYTNHICLYHPVDLGYVIYLHGTT